MIDPGQGQPHGPSGRGKRPLTRQSGSTTWRGQRPTGGSTVATSRDEGEGRLIVLVTAEGLGIYELLDMSRRPSRAAQGPGR